MVISKKLMCLKCGGSGYKPYNLNNPKEMHYECPTCYGTGQAPEYASWRTVVFVVAMAIFVCYIVAGVMDAGERRTCVDDICQHG